MFTILFLPSGETRGFRSYMSAHGDRERGMGMGMAMEMAMTDLRSSKQDRSRSRSSPCREYADR